MDVVIGIGLVVFVVGLSFHLYRVSKDIEWGEKLVIVCLLVGFFMVAGHVVFETSDGICPSCETVYDVGDKYCSECGTLIVLEDK